MSNNYESTREAPAFIPYRNINARKSMTVEEFDDWRSCLPASSGVDMAIRLVVRGFYDLQSHRVRLGNQVFAQLRSKLGLEPATKEQADKVANKVIEKLRTSYKLVTEGAAKSLPSMKEFKSDGVIGNYAELIMVDAFLSLADKEEQQKALIPHLIRDIPIYSQFLSQIHGWGPLLSAFIIGEVNVYRAPNISSVWAYFGLDVHPDGRGRSKRDVHMEPRWMKKRKGTSVDGDEGYKMEQVTLRTHDVRKKAKVVGTGADSILKACIRWIPCTEEEYLDADPAYSKRKNIKEDKQKGIEKQDNVPHVLAILGDSPYAKIYMDTKHRLTHSQKPCPRVKKLADGQEVHLTWSETSDAHRHRAAARYMIKMFLADLWLAWRKLEGLPVTETYAVAKLGHRPHHAYAPYEHVGNNRPSEPRVERYILPFSEGHSIGDDFDDDDGSDTWAAD